MRLPKLKYPNLTFFVFSVLLALVLAWFGVLDRVFVEFGDLGYAGALLAGLLLPITFTAPIATVTLFYLGGHYEVVPLVLLATFGALIGDLIIFTFVKDRTLAEIESIRAEYRADHRKHDHYKRHKALLDLFRSKPFHALALFVGALLIASPFPDELGVAIFASYRLNIHKFIPLSLFLNGIGIWLIILAGKTFIG
ncbi:hypothetical protein KKH05_01085 [Patescibacteria group bacterium]|nr:hypothetical protein [Patescibacteria group bacterium]